MGTKHGLGKVIFRFVALALIIVLFNVLAAQAFAWANQQDDVLPRSQNRPALQATVTSPAVASPRAVNTPVPPAPRATSTPEPVAWVSTNPANELSLATLGYQDKTMRGPYDSASFTFSLPADWQLVEGGTIVLSFSTTAGEKAAAMPAANLGAVGGTLEVDLNDTWQTTIQLDRVGERTIAVPIRKGSLNPARRGGRHDLKLLLDSAVDCAYDWHTTVVVKSSSLVVLPHQAVAMPTDLRLLPRPIYQQLYMPETAVIVVPDQPTTGELDAALSVAAGFGQMTSGKLGVSLIPVAQLSKDLQSSNHLIFVGKPAAFPMLGQVQLASPAAGSGFKVEGMKPDSGIIQLGVSPWNSSKVVLVVSGDSDAGMDKAGQAVSSGSIKVSNQNNLALVSEVRSDVAANAVSVDRSLESLGYSNVTLQSFGFSGYEYRFDVPLGQSVNGDAYLDLSFNHTTLLEYERSGAVVYLNDEPISSIHLTDDTAKGGVSRIAIPRSTVRRGTNRLGIEVNLVPRSVCVDPNLAFLWITIRSDSNLHIPLGPATTNDSRRVADLATYPQALSSSTTLGNVAFVLPAKDPSAWGVAAKLAFNLGNAVRPVLADLAVAFSDNVPDNIRKTRDLVVVGRPSTLPILAELKDALPAYFAAGSEQAIERGVRVVYQLPPDANVGYLEMLPAPWSPDRVIVGVLGSTEQGVRWAGDALTVSRLRGKLGGDYAFVNGEQVVPGDTNFGSRSASILPTVVPVVSASQPTAVPIASAAPLPERTTWILPVIAVAVGVMVLILLIVLVSALRGRTRTS